MNNVESPVSGSTKIGTLLSANSTKSSKFYPESTPIRPQTTQAKFFRRYEQLDVIEEAKDAQPRPNTKMEKLLDMRPKHPSRNKLLSNGSNATNETNSSNFTAGTRAQTPNVLNPGVKRLHLKLDLLEKKGIYKTLSLIHI
eukprot:TRINITY_DN11955_c0_g1_i3.p1 TRINITY_DN11955_c0_g1~~TRINITY_DN11955_c0_g1_i3.p1  ORF type:complete len:141 (+),score=16.10 TRINITY_DN11955_c0_g1_i3:99-521(+)